MTGSPDSSNPLLVVVGVEVVTKAPGQIVLAPMCCAGNLGLVVQVVVVVSENVIYFDAYPCCLCPNGEDVHYERQWVNVTDAVRHVDLVVLHVGLVVLHVGLVVLHVDLVVLHDGLVVPHVDLVGLHVDLVVLHVGLVVLHVDLDAVLYWKTPQHLLMTMYNILM